MKILAVSDEEAAILWDHYRPGMLEEYDLILSCGDLKAEYLSFLVTMARCPVLYVPGNHDGKYETAPPEGCDCIDGRLVVYRGLRILGLGGSLLYNRGKHQYTQQQMARRVRKLRRAIGAAGGVDIVVTHAPPLGVGDLDDHPHRGFSAFLQLLERYRPQYLLHGHIHLHYGQKLPRVRTWGETAVINCCGRYALEAAPASPSPPPSLWRRLYLRLFVKNLELWDP